MAMNTEQLTHVVGELREAMQAMGLHEEASKKWLGIDYQPGADKPKQPTRLARLGSSLYTVVLLSWW